MQGFIHSDNFLIAESGYLKYESDYHYSNVGQYVYIIQITTNVIYVKVLVIVAEICTTFKDNNNM